jgi:hypothetical protein
LLNTNHSSGQDGDFEHAKNAWKELIQQKYVPLTFFELMVIQNIRVKIEGKIGVKK